MRKGLSRIEIGARKLDIKLDSGSERYGIILYRTQNKRFIEKWVL